jgi:hypothetical protein
MLTASYVEWRRDWEAAQREMREQQLVSAQLEQRRSMDAQVAALRDELAASLASVQNGTADYAALQKLLAEQEEAAREARVGELMQLAARRIQQLALSRGWLVWAGQYEQRRWERGVLAKAAGRLTRPKLTACYVEWRCDWEAAQREAERQARDQLLAGQQHTHTEERSKMEKELQKLKEQLAAERAAAELVSGSQVAEAKRLLAEQEEAAREARVGELMQLAARRMQQLALSRGWLVWAGQYEQRRWERGVLAKAAGRLTRPKLTASYVEWRRDWEAVLREAERHQLVSAQLEQRRSMDAQVESLRDELAASLASVQNGTADYAALQKLLAAQEEAAREARVGELMQLAARRIQQLALSRGWLVWAGQYEQRRWERGVLAKAAGRLTRPKLTASYVEWRCDWEIGQREMRERQLVSAQLEQRRSMDAQVLALRDELAASLASLQNGTADYAALQKLLAEQEEAAREARVGELMQLAARRIQQLALSRGWLAWAGQYEQRRWQQSLLAKAAGRLTRPKLTACYAEWRRDWELTQREEEKQNLDRLLSGQKQSAEQVAKRSAHSFLLTCD